MNDIRNNNEYCNDTGRGCEKKKDFSFYEGKLRDILKKLIKQLQLEKIKSIRLKTS